MANKKKSNGKSLARRRGSDFEKRVANRLGGVRWEGLDGDVEARGYRIECKYRAGLGLEGPELREWLEQVNRYRKDNWSKDQKWALAFTGGQGFANSQIYVTIPLEEFDRLTKVDEDARLLQAFKEKYPDIQEMITNVVFALAAGLKEEELAFEGE